MSITGIMAITAAMADTAIIAILVNKAIRPIISNKAKHIYVAANMTNTDTRLRSSVSNFT